MILQPLYIGNVFSKAETTDASAKIYSCKGSGADAQGYYSAKGFTVIKGSTVSDHIVDSFTAHVKCYADLREKLEKLKVIDDRKFTIDYEFQSPSAASCVVLGRPSNGKTDWK